MKENTSDNKTNQNQKMKYSFWSEMFFASNAMKNVFAQLCSAVDCNTRP